MAGHHEPESEIASFLLADSSPTSPSPIPDNPRHPRVSHRHPFPLHFRLSLRRGCLPSLSSVAAGVPLLLLRDRPPWCLNLQ
ncbi:unnamed protein product [Linum trigynum]|uniref:Uncharacterized protein n=1 Tax=Linum trigynum TaxID=586398 RepID=A0AAV2EVJ0_9ROSI